MEAQEIWRIEVHFSTFLFMLALALWAASVTDVLRLPRQKSSIGKPLVLLIVFVPILGAVWYWVVFVPRLGNVSAR